MKYKNTILISLKGLLIGASMLVPGVSGGTMAIILGIYDELIHSVNNIFKDFKKSFLFLFKFCVGAGIGFLLFARLISAALEKYELPVMYLFIGAILGGIPLLLKQTGIKKNDGKQITFGVIAGLLGLGLVLALEQLPESSFKFAASITPKFLIMQIITGFVIAIALVLPGISTSHMLLVLGMYPAFLLALEHPFDHILFLAFLAVSVVIGVFVITKPLEMAMKKYPQLTYCAIIGFVAGSVITVFPDFPTGIEILVCVITLAVGCFTINRITSME